MGAIQNFQEFLSKTQWIGSVQPEKFRKHWSTFWGGPLFPVGPVWILIEWIAPDVTTGFYIDPDRERNLSLVLLILSRKTTNR